MDSRFRGNDIFRGTLNSFNNYIEILVLGALSLIALISNENRKTALLSLAWFLIGLLPQLFLAEHPRPYYLNISLLGFAILLSLGLKYACEKLYTMKYLFTIVVLSLCIVSARINMHTSEYVRNFYEYETFINTIVSDLKNDFPSFPDNSLICIKNVSPDMVWLLGYGSVISLNYNNTLAVYFEGFNKKLPEEYQRIFYFKYDTNRHTLKFIEERLQ